MALDILNTLVTHLQNLTPTSAVALKTWLEQDGLAQLKPHLLALPSLSDKPPPIEKKVEVKTTWTDVFAQAGPILEKINAFLLQDNAACNCQYVPEPQNVYRAFTLTPLANVKVVIVGQDPYHTVRKTQPIADGLAFSVARGLTIPPSLRNIFTELRREYPGTYVTPSHGSLEAWATQGVLLLNAALTTRPGVAGAHHTVWSPFLQYILKAILTAHPKCIFVLWGADAKSLKPTLLKLSKETHILEAAHPVAYSGFFGNGHFIKINEILTAEGLTPIIWQT